MRYRIMYIVFFAMLFVVSSNINAQKGKKDPFTTKSKRAIKAYQRALTFYKNQNFDEAIIDVNMAIMKDSNFLEAYLLAGQMYEEMRVSEKSLEYYRHVVRIDADFYPTIIYVVALKELELGLYESALLSFKQYKAHPKIDVRLVDKVEDGIKRAEFGIEQKKNPVKFNPENLGGAINTVDDEYINTVSTDESMLIFTKLYPKPDIYNNEKTVMDEDFFISKKSKDGEWQNATKMSNTFNTKYNEGAMSMSPDQSILVFAAVREKGKGRMDIYFSQKKGRHWTMPANIGGEINSYSWDSQACLSSDGKTIYFVSLRKGGVGESDIWVAEKLGNGKWGNVKNLGNVVNTKGKEMTPFIHPDGNTLYFASDGHIGMGGLDLFMTKKDENGNWSEPQNLGYPINDYDNQMGIVINAHGNLAYISSIIEGGKGGFDIYSFELNEDIRPTSVNYMKGVVVDAKTKKPLKADFELFDLNTNKMIVSSQSDPITGSFLVVIPSGVQLGLNVSRDGFLFYSDQFEVVGDFNSFEPYKKKVALKKLEPGQRIVLENIFFASNSYELNVKSFPELQKVKELLDLNLKIKIEISGFTDNIGSISDNLNLSQLRAKSVYDYLLSIGVEAKKLTYKGYGESNPISDNDTEEGRKRNRRTELKIISNK